MIRFIDNMFRIENPGVPDSQGSKYPLDAYAKNVEIDDGDYEDDVDMIGNLAGKRGRDEVTPDVRNKVVAAVENALGGSRNLNADLPAVLGKCSYLLINKCRRII